MTLRLVSRLGAYDDRGGSSRGCFGSPRTWCGTASGGCGRTRTPSEPVGRGRRAAAAWPTGWRATTSRPTRAWWSARPPPNWPRRWSKLDELTRQMIILRHYGQLSYREIADLCECPVGTVLARVHRGLKALRRCMGGNDDAE